MMRDRLLDLGVTILSEQGYHATGLKQILDTAGVPKGSFYHYFRNKDHFGAEVIKHYTDRVIAQCDAHMKEPGVDGLTALKHYLEFFIEKSRASGFREGCLLGNLGSEAWDAGEAYTLALKLSLR